MEEEYLRYLRENNKELYDQAISSANWSVKWRDEKITKLQSEVQHKLKVLDENKKLLDALRQIRILNADKDCDIKWICEQALKGE